MNLTFKTFKGKLQIAGIFSIIAFIGGLFLDKSPSFLDNIASSFIFSIFIFIGCFFGIMYFTNPNNERIWKEEAEERRRIAKIRDEEYAREKGRQDARRESQQYEDDDRPIKSSIMPGYEWFGRGKRRS